MWEIPGVEHVYSTAGDGYALVTVRFKVGEDQEQSVAQGARQAARRDGPGAARRAAAAGQAALDRRRADPGAHAALARLRLQRAARRWRSHLEDEIRTIPDVAETSVIGGEPRQMRVTLDPARLAAERRHAGRGGDGAAGRQRAAARRASSRAATQVYLVRRRRAAARPRPTSAAWSSRRAAARRSTCATSPTVHGGVRRARRPTCRTPPRGDGAESAVTISVAKRPRRQRDDGGARGARAGGRRPGRGCCPPTSRWTSPATTARPRATRRAS